jgi:hypothetical protein
MPHFSPTKTSDPAKRLLSAPDGRYRDILTGTAIILIAVGIGGAAIGVLADRPHTYLRFSAGWLAVAITGFAVVELLHAELWRRLVVALGVRMESRRSFAIWCVSAIARYVPTNMLMPVLRVSMSRSHKVPRSICVASLVYEAALATSAALLVGAYCIIGLPALRGDVWRWGVLLIPLLSMLALHPRGVGLVSDRLLRRLGRDPLPSHLSVEQLLRFVAGYVASFLLAGACLLAVVLAFHPLSSHDVPAVLGAYAVGFAATLVAFVLPGGLGAREIALAGVLSAVMPTLVATTASVAVRLIQIATELLLALVTWWIATRHEARGDRVQAPIRPRTFLS